MRRITTSWHLLAAVALALAGVGAGHVVEYVLVAPDGHDRHELLAHTGHQYLPVALRGVAFLGIATLAAVFLAAMAGAAGGDRPSRPSQRIRWAFVLPVAQPVAFAALEVGERLLAHASLAGLATVLLVGLPLQVVLGLLGVALVAGLDHAGERAGSSFRRPTWRRRGRRSVRPSALAHLPTSAVLWALAPTRGPPPVGVT